MSLALAFTHMLMVNGPMAAAMTHSESVGISSSRGQAVFWQWNLLAGVLELEAPVSAEGQHLICPDVQLPLMNSRASSKCISCSKYNSTCPDMSIDGTP